MRISLKLAASFAVMATLVGLVGYSYGTAQRQVENDLERLTRSALLKVDGADMSVALSAIHLSIQQMLREQVRVDAPATDAESLRRFVRRYRDSFETHQYAVRRSLERSLLAQESYLKEVRGGSDSDRAARRTLAALNELADVNEQYRLLTAELLDLAEEGSNATESFFDDRVDPHFRDRMLPQIEALQQHATADFTPGVRGVQRAMARARSQRNTISLASLAAALGLGLLISWSVGRPLAKLTRATTELAEGRLETRVNVRSRDEVGSLARAFNDMAASLQSKTVAKSYVDNILCSMHEMLIVTDPSLHIQRVNPAATRELGFAEDELIGQPLSAILDEPADFGNDDADLSQRLFDDRERNLKSKSERLLPVWFTASPLRDADGIMQGVVCVASNIAQRKAVEQQLRDSLTEKEVLLKEVHHRVKNNLQIISSLLNLQAKAAPTREAAKALRDSQSRVHSMALIHEHLYQSENLADIDFSDYVHELTAHLSRSLGAAARSIAVRLEVERTDLPIDLAVPCGMIVNELVTNAMEHAFPDERPGEIRVGFRTVGERRELTVGDNGVGFTHSEDVSAGAALGLTVVRALTQQINAKLKLERDSGTHITILFSAYPKAS